MTHPGEPPFKGVWVKRESLPDGLDAAKTLNDICWYSPCDRLWLFGITSDRVQYWVRIHPDPEGVNPS